MSSGLSWLAERLILEVPSPMVARDHSSAPLFASFGALFLDLTEDTKTVFSSE